MFISKKKTEWWALAQWDHMVMDMPYGIQQQQPIQPAKAVRRKEFFVLVVAIYGDNCP